ncbi:MAG: TonB-dependent receptor plug domain-containing protein [Gemmatimonadota bacterium]
MAGRRLISAAGRRAACVLVFLASLSASAEAQDRPVPQKPVEPGRIPADSARADTLRPVPVRTVIDSLRGTLRPETAEAQAEPEPHKVFPPRLEGEEELGSTRVYEWDLAALNESTALSLLDLLEEGVPGFTSLRSDFFGGPHQVLQGLLGPGFLRVFVDGRELTTLGAGQVDLTRVSLANLERVRVLRHADGWIAELTTISHGGEAAYSRIAAATGTPSLSLIRGVFANGLGRDFAVATAIDLLNTGGTRPTDRFDFWGKVSWMPGDGAAGISLRLQTESLERTLLSAENLTRRKVFLHARGNVTDRVQVETFAGSSEIRDGDSTRVRARHAGLSVIASTGRARGTAGFDVHDDPEFPSLRVHTEVAVRPGRRLAADAGARLESWDRFTTREVRAGVRYEPDLGLGLMLTAQGATGTRGIPFPAAATADSVSFDLASGSAEVSIGAFRLSETVEIQRLERQLPFRAGFDSLQAPIGPITVRAFETGVSGPVLPLSALVRGLAPIRLRGFWRFTTRTSGPPALFLPENLARGELFFRDAFFEGDLDVRLSLGLNRRTSILAPASPPDPLGSLVTIPTYTSYDWSVVIKLLDARIWWRVENLQGTVGRDLPGFDFPTRRNAFGVKWEFFN